MNAYTFAKMLSIIQIVFGAILFGCSSALLITSALQDKTDTFISFCFLVLWVVSYNMLRWSIKENKQETTNNKKIQK